MLLEDLELSVLICQRSLSLDLPEMRLPDRLDGRGLGPYRREPAHQPRFRCRAGEYGLPDLHVRLHRRAKAVVAEHRNVVDRISILSGIYPENSQDRTLLLASYGFDFSIVEIFGTLCAGACAVVLGPDEHRDPAAVVRVLSEEKITLLHCVPSMLRELVDTDGFSSCRELACCGLRWRTTAGHIARCIPSNVAPAASITSTGLRRSRSGPPSGSANVRVGTSAFHRAPRRQHATVRARWKRATRPDRSNRRTLHRRYRRRSWVLQTAGTHLGAVLPNPFRPGTRFYRTGDQVRYRRTAHWSSSADWIIKCRSGETGWNWERSKRFSANTRR